MDSKRLLGILLTLIALSTQAAADAFPGAEGYGKMATGGRGGRICRVTTLADSGAGSLRACMEACGPRIVVFDVSGTIEVETRIQDTCGQITIAGQTSPGGVQIAKAIPAGDYYAPLEFYGGNVIVRYLRIRPGNGCEQGNESCPSPNTDGFDVLGVGARYSIFDHVSVSWAADENLSWYGASVGDAASYGTFQWSISSEPLDTGSSAGRQGYASILLRSADLTLHHNLWSHFRDRAPQWDGDGTLDFVNNVIYTMEAGASTGRSRDTGGGTPVTNYSSNHAKRGPSSTTVAMYDPHDDSVAYDDGANVYTDPMERVFTATYTAAGSPFSVPYAVTKTTAAQAVIDVLAEAGASKRITCSGEWVSNRDSVDERIIDEYNAGTGEVPNHPEDVGGWPTLTGGAACADSDADGMPDDFEARYSFDRSLPDGNLDRDSDGYTNVEEYLNGSDPGAPAQSAGESSGAGWLPFSF